MEGQIGKEGEGKGWLHVHTHACAHQHTYTHTHKENTDSAVLCETHQLCCLQGRNLRRSWNTFKALHVLTYTYAHTSAYLKVAYCSLLLGHLHTYVHVYYLLLFVCRIIVILMKTQYRIIEPVLASNLTMKICLRDIYQQTDKLYPHTPSFCVIYRHF